MKILVVEDELGLLENIVSYLSDQDTVCDGCFNVEEALGMLSSHHYDCIVLDIGLPDGEGFEILKFIKERRQNESILIISARNSLTDKLKGLNIGADDYLIKPFHLAELRARVLAVIRRGYSHSSSLIEYNEISIDLGGNSVKVNRRAIILTKKEYDMLLYFIANKEKVISKTALTSHLWGDEMEMAENSNLLYAHVKNLRKKLIDASCRDYLKSLYGIGYKFSAGL